MIASKAKNYFSEMMTFQTRFVFVDMLKLDISEDLKMINTTKTSYKNYRTTSII